jgi:hypothetical protein
VEREGILVSFPTLGEIISVFPHYDVDYSEMIKWSPQASKNAVFLMISNAFSSTKSEESRTGSFWKWGRGEVAQCVHM